MREDWGHCEGGGTMPHRMYRWGGGACIRGHALHEGTCSCTLATT